MNPVADTRATLPTVDASGWRVAPADALESDPQAAVVNLGHRPGPACPSCGQYDMRMVEGEGRATRIIEEIKE